MTVQESRVIGPFRCCRHALPVNKHLSRRLKIAFKLATSCRQNTDSVEIVVVRDQFWLLSDRFRFEESSLHAPELRVSFWQSPEAVFVCVFRSATVRRTTVCAAIFSSSRLCAELLTLSMVRHWYTARFAAIVCLLSLIKMNRVVCLPWCVRGYSPFRSRARCCQRKRRNWCREIHGSRRAPTGPTRLKCGGNRWLFNHQVIPPDGRDQTTLSRPAAVIFVV